MASVALRILCAASFLFMAVRSDGVSLATGPAAAAAPAAPVAAAPSSGKLNLTAILEKAGQFNTYISLLKSTQVGNQLQIQLSSSQQGITLFAPSDAAFAALKPGTLNALTDQDKVALLQYHALPSYYTFGQFQTVSNPVRTVASGNGGPFGMNFTAIGNNVNVSTGIVNTAISGAVYSQNPVAVYQVDKVLLPTDIFGPKAPAAAPTPVAGAPMVTPTVSPSSDGSASATSGCRSRFVFSNGVALAMAVLSVGFVACL
ncbi:hypothetical protein SUGI_0770720 [Cryptomeria japonica]|uniref:fasciclin-like arabinogalactan protein 12 n=1 Tax=Cryptomeria japonica TaxID=3369 RepID=UPI0024146CFC|nr:fasciclin-like arabinogalactan protein 12 [Cryptomeria japonica]GLJ37881.1 hypothetical protein SUGI_0770720 [Cryptomeria japonica]